MTSRLYDPKWQTKWLDPNTRWTVTFLHKIGHPITPTQWMHALALRDLGASTDQAVSLIDSGFDFSSGFNGLHF